MANLIRISHFSISTYQIPHQITHMTQMILKEIKWNVLYRFDSTHACTMYAHIWSPMPKVSGSNISKKKTIIKRDKFVTGYVLPTKCTNKCHRFPIYFKKEKKNDYNWRYIYSRLSIPSTPWLVSLLLICHRIRFFNNFLFCLLVSFWGVV